MADHAGNVTGRKHQRVADALQLFVDLDKAAIVQRQAGLLQPRCSARLRDPDDLVHRQLLAVGGLQSVGRHLCHRAVAVRDHLALRQHVFKTAPHALAVRGQYLGTAGEQVKAQLVRVAA